MTTLNLTVSIHTRLSDGDKARKNLLNLVNSFLSQCLPAFLLPEHWSKRLFFYYPDEESEMCGVECLGMTLKLQRTCKSAHRAVLIAQVIQTVSLIFDSLYGEDFSFQIDSVS